MTLHRIRLLLVCVILMANPVCSFSRVGLTDPIQKTKAKATTRLHSLVPIEIKTLAGSVFSYSGNVPIVQSSILNASLFFLLRSKLSTMLTPAGFLHSFLLGTGLWTTLGWRGWLYCVSYLFLGSMVTKIRFAEKEKKGIAEGRGGRRGPENVWGSAATGLACAIASTLDGYHLFGISSETFLIGYVASMATKLADTFASEIGKAYGKTTFLITTFQRVEPGTEGAVSAEGTAAAFVGGLLLSSIGLALRLIKRPADLVACTIAAFIATNIESLLGALLQGKDDMEWMTNEVVNFLNTFIGATIAMAARTLIS